MTELTAWVEATFGHAPRDPELFRQAVTHGSRTGEISYERLEFLGDRVLGLSMAEWLYERFPNEPEGVLSRRIHTLVSGATCAEVGREIGAGEHVRVDKGVKATIRDGDSVLGDVVESLLGALYLEAGYDAAREWVRRHWAERITGEETARKHPKAELQEWALARNLGLPAYTSLGESGPDHLPSHLVAVRVGEHSAEGSAATKREAEANAARTLLDTLATIEPRRKKSRANTRIRK